MTTENELEKEGEIAADFIEEFLDLADLDGDLEIEFKQERVYLTVDSDGRVKSGQSFRPRDRERHPGDHPASRSVKDW
jgi:spoIIIJ-associated protein